MSSDPSELELRARHAGKPGDRQLSAKDIHRERVARLFETEHDRVVHFIVAMTGSWPEARDIVAQAFEQVLELEATDVEHLKAYVYRVARNIALNRARSRAVRRKLDRVAIHEISGTPSSPEPDLLELQQAQLEEQRVQRLREAIDKLPPRCRMAVQWRVWDQMPYAEILGQFAANGVIVNERTVRRWIEYAYQFCRQEILRAEESEGGGK